MPDYKRFLLPDTAEGLTDAEILAWHVKPGDDVKVNQIIVEIETAKAAVELPCPFAGRVTELLVDAGQTVDVGTPIIVIDIDPNGAAAPSTARPSRSGCPTWSVTGSRQVTAQAPRPRRTPTATPARPPRSRWSAVTAVADPLRSSRPSRSRRSRAAVTCRWPSRRSASWPRNWASTCTRWPAPARPARSPVRTWSRPPPRRPARYRPSAPAAGPGRANGGADQGRAQGDRAGHGRQRLHGPARDGVPDHRRDADDGAPGQAQGQTRSSPASSSPRSCSPPRRCAWRCAARRT